MCTTFYNNLKKRKEKKQEAGMYTSSVLLKGKSDQAPANEFLLLGNEHHTCNTLFTSTHTHMHTHAV